MHDARPHSSYIPVSAVSLQGGRPVVFRHGSCFSCLYILQMCI
jgi:hypothetical protein